MRALASAATCSRGERRPDLVEQVHAQARRCQPGHERGVVVRRHHVVHGAHEGGAVPPDELGDFLDRRARGSWFSGACSRRSNRRRCTSPAVPTSTPLPFRDTPPVGPTPAGPVHSSVRRYSVKSGTGSVSRSATRSAGPLSTDSPQRRWTMPGRSPTRRPPRTRRTSSGEREVALSRADVVDEREAAVQRPAHDALPDSCRQRRSRSPGAVRLQQTAPWRRLARFCSKMELKPTMS